jgi:hypothetical protein
MIQPHDRGRLSRTALAAYHSRTGRQIPCRRTHRDARRHHGRHDDEVHTHQRDRHGFFFGALAETLFGYDTGLAGVALLSIKKEFPLTRNRRQRVRERFRIAWHRAAIVHISGNERQPK